MFIKTAFQVHLELVPTGLKVGTIDHHPPTDNLVFALRKPPLKAEPDESEYSYYWLY